MGTDMTAETGSEHRVVLVTDQWSVHNEPRREVMERQDPRQETGAAPRQSMNAATGQQRRRER